MATDSEHSRQSQTHPRLLECDSGPPIHTQSANPDRVESKVRNCRSDFPVLGESRGGHVRVSPQHPPTSIHVSSSGATKTGGRCSVARLAGEINVHVSADPSAQQDHSEVTGHRSSRSDTDCSLVAITTVVSTPTSSLCGPPTVSSIPPRSPVSAESGIHLRRKVVRSARMETLMRHYKAAGFSDKISRLAAAPRRPSTNRTYNDRWLRFTHWAAREGFDPLNPSAAQIAAFLYSLFDTHGLSPQTVKGY